jgi:hypothetical protein
MSLLALPPAIFPDLATGFEAIQAYAKQHGYALFKRDTRPNKVVYACDRAGKYDPKGKNSTIYTSKRRKNTGLKKCDCLMKVALRRDKVLNS